MTVSGSVRRGHRLRRATAGAVLMGLLAVSGCAQIPRSTPVHTLEAPTKNTDATVQYRLQGPKDGATQAEVLDGFLQSNKGVQENLSHAREYLSTSLKNEWRPEKLTTVYEQFPNVLATSDPNTFEVQYQPLFEIDEHGLRRDTPDAQPKTVRITLVKENGQYRISKAPDELLLSETDATVLLEQRSLYFYSPDFARAVPDTRWFLRSPKLATNVLNALLNGPAPYLKDSVTSAFAKPFTFSNTTIAVLEKQAQVDFPSEYWNNLKTLQRQQVKQQLDLTLAGVKGAESVSIRVNARQVPELDAPTTDFVTVVNNPQVDSTQVGVAKEQLVWYNAVETKRIPGVPDTAVYSPRFPAVSYTKKQFTFLNASGSQMLSTGPNREVVLSQEGYQLTPPSFDTNNWVWTAVKPDKGAQTQIRAIAPGGAGAGGVTVSAEWLKDYSVSDLRIARDGVRVAIAAKKGGKDCLLLSAVVRGGDGAPKRLSPPVTVPTAGIPLNSVRWLSDSRMVVANLGSREEVKPVIVSQGGIEDLLSSLTGATDISVGNAPDQIFLIVGGRLYWRVGSRWFKSETSVSGLNFMG